MAIPKLALIPAAQGASLYSVLPANGVGDFNFTRGSAATRINSQGLIETVASGVSRLNYPLIDGVVNGCPSHLLEPLRTNLIQYSEDFSQGYWTKTGSSVVSGFVSPKGDLSAFKLVEDTSTGVHYVSAKTIPVTANKYSFSIIAKPNGRNKIKLALENYFIAGVYSDFDLINGTVVAGANAIGKITLLANGNYRCELSSTINAVGTGTAYGTVYLVNDSDSDNYTGDGVSGVYIFGAQLEQGSFGTSYIPNYGTSAGVTRSAETANGSGDASTFNDSEGVLYWNGSILDSSVAVSIGDGTINNRLEIQLLSSVFTPILNVNGVGQITGNYGAVNNNEFYKVAFKYKQNDFALWVNGIEIFTDTSGITFTSNTLNQLRLSTTVGSGAFKGNLKDLRVYDSALNNSDLETLTSWVSFTDMANSQLYSIK